MGPLLVVPDEVTAQFLLQVGPVLEGPQVDTLVLHAAPEPLHEDVVPVAALAVHADGDAVSLQDAGEGLAGELAPLIRIEDLGRSVTGQCLLQRVDTEVRVQGIGDPPRQDTAAIPVHHDHQVHKPACQRNVTDVGRPHLVWPVDRQAAQPVGIDPVALARQAGPWPWVDGLETHLTHQAADPLAVDPVPQPVEVDGHPAGSVDRRQQVLLIDQAHQHQILGQPLALLVVQRGAADAQQLTLPSQARGSGRWRLDHGQALGPAQRSSLRDKKSRSTVSLPISR